MKIEIITPEQISVRDKWITNISQHCGNFGTDTEKIHTKILEENLHNNIDSLLGHLRLCGVIPESFRHDSSEEKLYSKYTDIVINEGFKAIGLDSIVLKERSDMADVECYNKDYSFVADAKAFRLSRSAKNQKDFKIQALDNWKHSKLYAMVVCPIYQLPAKTSQIYNQAATRSVCIMTYTHLAVMVSYSLKSGNNKAMKLLHNVFRCVEAMNPSKSASVYWQTINRLMLDCDAVIPELWKIEKAATMESIFLSKKESLKFLSLEKERIMQLSKNEAIQEVLNNYKFDNRIKAIERIKDNGLLNVE